MMPTQQKNFTFLLITTLLLSIFYIVWKNDFWNSTQKEIQNTNVSTSQEWSDFARKWFIRMEWETTVSDISIDTCDLEVILPESIDTIPGASVTLFPSFNVLFPDFDFVWTAEPASALDFLQFPESLNPVVEIPDDIEVNTTFSYILTAIQAPDCIVADTIAINVAAPPIDNSNNDCIDAVQLCAEDLLIKFEPLGSGINDFANDNNESGCLSDEHFSAWYLLEFSEDTPHNANLEIILSPTNSNTDLDFAIWAANVNCNNLGAPIRCSFAAGSGLNTGILNDIGEETEGLSGDGFVEDLLVQPGDKYYLMIDNFVNEPSDIYITWGGTAAEFLLCKSNGFCDLEVTVPPITIACDDTHAILTTVISNGVPPYSFEWSTGATTDTLVISFNPPQEYCVTVTDSEGCSDVGCATFIQPSYPSLMLSIEQMPLCNGDNSGILSAIVSDGTPPFTFLWNNDASTATINQLAAGTYSVTVTDDLGCLITATVDLFEPEALSSSIESTTPASSPIAMDGSVSISINGGTPPYTFNGVDFFENTQTISGLEAGTYTLLVSDANECTVEVSFIIEAIVSTPLEITGISSNHPSCTGATDGSITLNVIGGLSPYSFTWDNGAANVQNPSNLGIGTYNVTVTDATGMTTTGMVTLFAPNIVQVSVKRVRPVTCFNGNTGSIEVNVTGGVPPYTFDWGIAVTTTPEIHQLSSGQYQVTVSDSNGCSAVSSLVTLTNPPPVMVTGSSTPDTGTGNGTASVSVSGGVLPYTIYWLDLDIQNINTVSNLTAGVYDVYIEDRFGCFVFESIIVGNGNPPRKFAAFNFSGNQIDDKDLVISPNPTNGIFNIQLNLKKADKIWIRVLDSSGRKVLEQEADESDFHHLSFDMTRELAGVYVVQIFIAQQIISKKIVIK